MTIDAQPAIRIPRLNPFILPSETDFRFILLILAVLASSIFIYSTLYFIIPANADYTSAAQQAYTSVAVAHPGTSDADLAARLAALEQYIYPADRRLASWVIGAVLVELMLASLLFLLIPKWKLWRGQLEPLQNRNEMREVMHYLTWLCQGMNLSRAPTFVWDPSDLVVRGVAFGRLGQYYVTLSAGLIYKFSVDRAAFRAVVLHELSHLRNRDINKTYFTVSIYWTFVVVALLPFLLVLLAELVLAASFSFTGSLYLLSINTILRLLTLSVLVYLTRNAVLRAREVYADARASLAEGPGGALSRVLQSLPTSKESVLPPLLRTHPTLAERSRVLTDPSQLFHVNFWDAFGTGAAVMIALPSVVDLLYSLHIGGAAGLTSQEVSFLGTGLILALLLGGFFVQEVWRSTLLKVTGGILQRTALPLGLGAVLGIFLGQLLSLQDLFSSNYARNVLFYLSFDIFWSLLLFISLFFFIRWIMMCVSAWLEVANKSSSPLPTYWVEVIMTGVGLALILGVFYWMRYLTLGISYTLTLASLGALLSQLLGDIQVAAASPFILPAFIVLWAYPLATWFWRTRVTISAGSSWAFLETPSPRLALPSHAPLRLGLALGIGIAGGLTFWVLLLLVPFEVRYAIPRAVRLTEQFTFVSFYVTIALAVLTQAVTAIIVMRRVQWLKVPQGLFAAFVAGSVAAMGLLGENVLAGGEINPFFFWTVVGTTISGGALVALLFAWIGMLGRRTVEVPHTVQPALPIAASKPKRRSWLKIGLGVGAVLFALLLTSVGSTALLAQVGRSITTATVTPTAAVTPTTSPTPLTGPSGLPVDPSAAAIIRGVETASAIDSKTQAPTHVTSTFESSQTLYLIFTVASAGSPGNVEIKLFNENHGLGKQIFTGVGPQGEYNLSFALNHFNLNLPAKMAIELYWCLRADCSDGRLAAVTYFTVVAPATQASNPYPPYGGNLRLNDALRANTLGYHWDDPVGCTFTGGAYQVEEPQQGYTQTCVAYNTNFSNFAYEVQVKIVKGTHGSVGGIMFRANPALGSFYDFLIGQDGSYALYRYDSDGSPAKTLSKLSSSAIHTGLNQVNVIAVVASGGTLHLYVNRQMIASVNDATYGSGAIGLVADALNNPSEVIFSDARVWVL